MTPQEFCIAESVRMAKGLSYRDMLRYLHGLLLLAGDCPEAAPLRSALMQIEVGDAQLELIAMGQLRLNLGADGDGQNGGPLS